VPSGSFLFEEHDMKKKPSTAIRKSAKAATLDARHHAGADMTPHLNLAGARRPGRVTQRVNVDFPEPLLDAIDREARRIGVTRQAYIKLRLADAVSQ
jgi:hypothetical protein